MSDIQRYFAPSESEPWKNHHGNWVRYADHVEALEDMKVRAYNDGRLYEGGLNVEALRQAVESERQRRLGTFEMAAWFADQWYAEGQRDALAGAVQRFNAMPKRVAWDGWYAEVEATRAAIKGETDAVS
jgi:hypothetical protein